MCIYIYTYIYIYTHIYAYACLNRGYAHEYHSSNQISANDRENGWKLFAETLAVHSLMFNAYNCLPRYFCTACRRLTAAFLIACRRETEASFPLALTGPCRLEGTTLADRLVASCLSSVILLELSYVYMYVCVYIYIYICIHVYMCIYIYIYTHTWVDTPLK